MTLVLGRTVVCDVRCGPPQGSDRGDPEEGELLREVVDKLNVTDNQTSVVWMSSLPPVPLKGMGLEPIRRWSARLGPVALERLQGGGLGDNNVLCLSGDRKVWRSSSGRRYD